MAKRHRLSPSISIYLALGRKPYLFNLSQEAHTIVEHIQGIIFCLLWQHLVDRFPRYSNIFATDGGRGKVGHTHLLEQARTLQPAFPGHCRHNQACPAQSLVFEHFPYNPPTLPSSLGEGVAQILPHCSKNHRTLHTPPTCIHTSGETAPGIFTQVSGPLSHLACKLFWSDTISRDRIFKFPFLVVLIKSCDLSGHFLFRHFLHIT